MGRNVRCLELRRFSLPVHFLTEVYLKLFKSVYEKIDALCKENWFTYVENNNTMHVHLFEDSLHSLKTCKNLLTKDLINTVDNSL